MRGRTGNKLYQDLCSQVRVAFCALFASYVLHLFSLIYIPGLSAIPGSPGANDIRTIQHGLAKLLLYIWKRTRLLAMERVFTVSFDCHPLPQNHSQNGGMRCNPNPQSKFFKSHTWMMQTTHGEVSGLSRRGKKAHLPGEKVRGRWSMTSYRYQKNERKTSKISPQCLERPFDRPTDLTITKRKRRAVSQSLMLTRRCRAIGRKRFFFWFQS